jgi:ABC-type transport system involved in cytochrome c biogenesis permease subunit
MITGAVGSERAWGSYWSWEPKQTATLVTWLVYLAYFHWRNSVGGRMAARWAVAGFFGVLFTYLVVNLFAPGLHDFGVLGAL